ncbi:MAG: hypothetical protein AAFS10_20910, partial [Myxococcota bacterium]
MRAHPLYVVLLATALFATACVSATDRSQDGLRTLLGPGLKHTDPAWDTLMNGSTLQAREALSGDGADETPEGRAWRALGRCEADHLLGHYGDALTACVKAVEAAPARPVAQWALLRLYMLSSFSSDFVSDVEPALQAIRRADTTEKGVQSSVLTRYLAARISMMRAFDAWYRSSTEKPFKADQEGVPTIWSIVGPASLYG